MRQLPRLTARPFRYGVHAASYLQVARRYTRLPIKQAVISASALSLLYPSAGILGYSREEFLADLIDEATADIRGALDAGADSVQIDFTEARLSLKLDPSGGLLWSFIALNNQVLDRFIASDRQRIGVHVCPGGDHDSTHSADVDYASLLPDLFQLKAGRFYLQMASEPDKKTRPAYRQSTPATQPHRLHRRYRPHQPHSRDSRPGTRTRRRSSLFHPCRAARHHRRLWLLSLRRRRFNRPGNRVQKDSGTR